MMPMLAQEQLQGLPDHFWKNFCIALFVCLGVVGVVVAIVLGIAAYYRKPAPVKVDDEPAINVRTKSPRYNHRESEQRYNETTGRLDGHDAELDSIWEEIAREDGKLRGEMQAMGKNSSDKFEAIAGALGRIEGALGIPPQKTK